MKARIYKYDKKLGRMVDATPEADRKICDMLAKDVRKIRRTEGEPMQPAMPKWNYASEAMAVDPADIPMAQEILRRHGVSTEYTPTGEPIIRSRAHRKAHAEAMGFYDRSGGYGDPQPRNL